MPARPLSAGTISFGLVTIPIKLYSASESSSSVSFNMLHAACRGRLKQQYVCPRDNAVVPREDTVKGYEFAKDQYVVFTEDEIKAMMQEAKKAIEIAEFVPLAQVDPLYFDNAYYLGPEKGGERAYRLLAEAMRKTGRGAIARWVARGKQNLVLLRPVEGGIVMQQLHYADEIRPITEVPIPDAEVKESELALAMQLIDQVSSSEFQPGKYEDEVRKAIQASIERKIQGQDVIAAPEEPRGQIIDLMEALKASLAGKAAGPAAATAEAADERRPARRAGRGAESKIRAVGGEGKG